MPRYNNLLASPCQIVCYAGYRCRLAEMPTGSAFSNFFILVHFFLDKKIRLVYLAVSINSASKS
jgi:hypothetical protein